MAYKVLVTGANGQLGSTIKALSSQFEDAIQFVFTDKTNLDITNTDAIDAVFRNGHFNYCVNCAAFTNVDLAETETEKATTINAIAVKDLAKTCKKYNVKLIHISTDYVFDGAKTSAYTETDLASPINTYGQTKLLGENHIKQILNDYFIIRTSWLYSKFNQNFVKTVYQKLLNGEQLKIIDSQQGTPTSCWDLAECIIFLVLNEVEAFGTYHFSAEGQTTWYDLGLHISKHIPKASNIIPIKTFESKAKRPRNSVLNTEKVRMLMKKNLPTWQNSVDKVILDLSREL